MTTWPSGSTQASPLAPPDSRFFTRAVSLSIFPRESDSACGGGTQTRMVVCVDGLGAVVSDGFCTGPKPVATQSCNEQACTAEVPSLGPVARLGLLVISAGLGGLLSRRRARS